MLPILSTSRVNGMTCDGVLAGALLLWELSFSPRFIWKILYRLILFCAFEPTWVCLWKTNPNFSGQKMNFQAKFNSKLVTMAQFLWINRRTHYRHALAKSKVTTRMLSSKPPLTPTKDMPISKCGITEQVRTCRSTWQSRGML